MLRLEVGGEVEEFFCFILRWSAAGGDAEGFGELGFEIAAGESFGKLFGLSLIHI